MEGMREARDRRELGMDARSGILTAGAVAGSSVVPVRRHHFYGD